MKSPQQREELRRKYLRSQYAAHADADAEAKIWRDRAAKDAKVYGLISTGFFLAGTIAAIISKNVTYTGRGLCPIDVMSIFLFSAAVVLMILGFVKAALS